jgi:hypothetical protein
MQKLYDISKEYLEEHYIKQQKSAQQICNELNIKSKTVILRLLKKYNIPSNSQFGKPNKNTKKFGDIHQSYICTLRLRAKNKKIDFNLDGDYLWKLFLKQKRKCALSGLLLVFPKAWGIKSKTNITASLDRIDSKLGYVKGNVQWVHKTINTMKMNMSDNEFIYFCKKVADYS